MQAFERTRGVACALVGVGSGPQRQAWPERGRVRKRSAALLLAMAASLLSMGEAHAEPKVRCQEVRFSVALEPGGVADYDMAAWLCARGTIRHKTIQVLIHGATFDHHYWNFPYQPETYSYVHHITEAGYAALIVDRIGYGLSSHPTDGLDVDLHTGAFTIHQVVQALRGGQMVVPGFGRVQAERVQLVGSSLGSFISLLEASTYKDVDGIVLTSFSHRVGSGGISSFELVIPAELDPKFSYFPLIPLFNYLSEAPGAREFLFYYLPNMDPVVAWLDTVLRQTWTVGEINDIVPTLMEPIDVEVPTLIINGDYDVIACDVPCTANDWLAGEAELYPPEACAEVQIVPEAGHALTLHRNAPEFFAAVQEWSDRRIGASTREPPPDPCP